MLTISSIFRNIVWIYWLGTGGGTQGSPALFYLLFLSLFHPLNRFWQQDYIQTKLVAKTSSHVCNNQPVQEMHIKTKY